MYTITTQRNQFCIFNIYNIKEKQHFPVKKTNLKINDLKVFKKFFR